MREEIIVRDWLAAVLRFPNKILAQKTSELVCKPSAFHAYLRIFLMLAALGSVNDVAADGAQFWVSFDSDRSNPRPLDSRQVQGDAYIFLLSEQAIKEVRFFLDNPRASGKSKSIDREAPYDFLKSSSSTAEAFDTSQLTDGAHVVSAKLLRADGSTTVVNASFVVTNMQAPIATDTSSQPYMVFSRSPDRSGILQPFANAEVKGKIYPFIVSGKRIARVHYSLDDGAYRAKRLAPFDLEAGDTAKAKAFDTSFHGEGNHILNAKIDFAGGESTTLSTSFTVANNSLPEPSGFISPSANLIDFGAVQVGTASSSKALTLTNTGYRAVNIEKIDFSGDYDSTSNTCGTLEPGHQCSVSINFSPIQFDGPNGILTIASNARNRQVVVNLVGIAQRF